MSQNTISRDKLTEKDKEAIEICGDVSKAIEDMIGTPEASATFHKKYGKIHYSREAGYGVGAGKLQRDALCTRGRQAKAPFSNRNLRWHPLVVAINCPESFTEMDLQIDNARKLLKFIPEDEKSITLYPKDVYKLEKPYCIPSAKWVPHIDELRNWKREDWENNWCTIPILEYSPRQWSVESFAVLGLSISAELFGVDLHSAYKKITQLLLEKFQKSGNFPDRLSEYYPKDVDNIVKCPLCQGVIGEYPAGLKKRERPKVWSPAWWGKSKRSEGEDESIQLTHAYPLMEDKINHNASSVRYGHRWCNVAMTDHSVDEVIEWMEAIISSKKDD